MIDRRDFLLTSSAVLALAGCGSTSPAPSTPTIPAPSAPSAETPVRYAQKFPLIADTASRLDAAKARKLSQHGVKTVFRYYSHLPASIPGKDLQPEEVRIILGEGLSIGSVFQHYNNCFRTFENKWGREDAEQALRMAEAAGQPDGSAIYFGVDADWPYQTLRDPIIAYFEDVKRAFEGSGISVGVYSNGCICNTIRERGLAEYFWLSGSTGHSGTQAFYDTERWTLFQNALDITPPDIGFAIDTNIQNPKTGSYFGQWSDRGAQTTSHDPSDVGLVFGLRQFLNSAVNVVAGPDAASAVLGSLRKDQNVRLLESFDDWMRVLTQEGGARAGVQAVNGYVPASSLLPMNRFPSASGYGLCGSATVPNDTSKYQNCERATSRIR